MVATDFPKRAVSQDTIRCRDSCWKVLTLIQVQMDRNGELKQLKIRIE